jgi:hypothetical protein
MAMRRMGLVSVALGFVVVSPFVQVAPVGSTLYCRPELQVVALLRAARPVVEVGPLVAAADDRGGRVSGVHD